MKSVAAQGLHDVVLDPDFARNRTLYFTYFAPPKGEAPASWPIEFFYERRLDEAVRRTPDDATRSRARGAGETERGQHDGSKMSTCSPKASSAASSSRATARCWSPAPTASGSTTRTSTAWNTTSPTTPISAATSPGRVIRINRDGSIPKDNPVARPRDRARRDVRARLQGSRRRGAQSADRRAVGDRSRPAGRRRDQHRPRRQGLRLARRVVRTSVRRAATRWPQERPRRRRRHVEARRRGADLLLGAVDRAVGDDVLHGRHVPGVERETCSSARWPVSTSCGSSSMASESLPRNNCWPIRSSAFAKSVRHPTARSTSCRERRSFDSRPRSREKHV